MKQAPSGAVKRIDNNGNVYYAVQEIDAQFKTITKEIRYYVDQENGISLDPLYFSRYRINSVAYSSHFKALVLYLNGKGIIALDRLCTMLNEMSDGRLNLRPGTIVSWTHEFGEKSEDIRKELLKLLLTCTILHIDSGNDYLSLLSVIQTESLNNRNVMEKIQEILEHTPHNLNEHSKECSSSIS